MTKAILSNKNILKNSGPILSVYLSLDIIVFIKFKVLKAKKYIIIIEISGKT
jgi:hypothetical protein